MQLMHVERREVARYITDAQPCVGPLSPSSHTGFQVDGPSNLWARGVHVSSRAAAGDA